MRAIQMLLFSPEEGEAQEWAIAHEAVRDSVQKEADKWVALAACPVIEAYTDGSAPVRNPGGQAGFAAVLVGYYVAIPKDEPERPTPAVRLDLSGYVPARTKEPKTSNNRAEIGGLLLALETLRHLGQAGWVAREATLWSDSRYAVMCASGQWKRKKNTDLWAAHDGLLVEVHKALPKRGFALRWVKGHAGNEYNEAADKLATFAAFNFDEAAYARFRAVQSVTGREMPGEAALEAAGVTGRSQATGDEGHETKSESGEEWLRGADYALGVQTDFKGREGGAGKGTATGKYRIWAKDGRSRGADVEHDGVRLPDEFEYLTLIAALGEIVGRMEKRGRDPREFGLLVYGGRELVVKQLRGEYRVKAESLLEPYREASALLKRFKWVEIEWKRGKEIDEVMRYGPT
jgi:ribonuclease HI